MSHEKETLFEQQCASGSLSISPGEIVIGIVDGIDAQGLPLVDYAGNPCSDSLVAVSTLSITHQDIGRQVALLFAEGELHRPVIMGLIHSPLNALIENFQLSLGDNSSAEESDLSEPSKDISADGERLLLEAKEEITLKCGDASITLTKAGKVLIRGKYLLSRSSGVNRIQGGSVQVN